MNLGGKKSTIGVIRVVTTDDREFLETHARLISDYLHSSDVAFVTECIKGFPNGISTEAEEKRAIPSVKETGKRLVHETQVDSLLVSCAADPGVRELKQELRVPVIGAGSAAASFSLMLGTRVCVLGIEDQAPKVVEDILKDHLVGYVKPPGVTTTHDIQESLEEYINLSRGMVANKKADVILLACTGLSTARIAPNLEETLHVPVVDPVLVSGLVAYYAARGNTLRSENE